MPTVGECLEVALSYWEGRPGAKVMASRATLGASLMGATREASGLTARDAEALLSALHSRGLSPRSVQEYYATVKRMLALAGVGEPVGWPAVVRSKAQCVRPSSEAAAKAHAWLVDRRWFTTADVATLLMGSGFRLSIKAIVTEPLRLATEDNAYDILHVGATRSMPLMDPAARTLLRDPERLSALRRVAVRTHQRRWSEALSAVESGRVFT